MIARTLHVLLWMGLGLSAHAENGCPLGYAPAKIPVESSSDCAPIPGYWEAQPPEPAAVEPLWTSRWGAIAIGSTASGGGVGVATGESSRRKAESAAMKTCRDTGGGKQCEVYAYRDQCAAVAWGAAFYVTWSAESIELASRVALEKCRAKTADCQIFYSACSLPQRVR